jgi:hypothetical protein
LHAVLAKLWASALKERAALIFDQFDLEPFASNRDVDLLGEFGQVRLL